jgi:hypothetical protein
MGIIDSSYRGPLMGAVLPFQFQAASIKDGARLFQVLAPDMGHISKVVFRHQSELDVTARGSGGFGSSGLSGQMVPSGLSAVGSSGLSALSGLAISPKLVNQAEGFVPTSTKPALKAEDLDV